MSGKDRSIARFDRWAADYDHSALQPVLYAPIQQATLCLTARHLPQPRAILDVGCGTGALLRQAAQRFTGARLVGVDPARAMVLAASAATPPELPIRLVNACAEQLPFAGGVFDLVTATLSLQHWSDQPAGIGQIRRVLAPGGVFALAEVFAIRQRRRAVWARRWRGDRVELPADVEAMLAAHELTVIDGQRLQGLAPICRVVVVVARAEGAVPAAGAP